MLLYRHTDARSSNSLSMGETGQSRKVANRASMRTLRLWQRYVYATVTSMPTLRLCQRCVYAYSRPPLATGSIGESLPSMLWWLCRTFISPHGSAIHGPLTSLVASTGESHERTRFPPNRC